MVAINGIYQSASFLYIIGTDTGIVEVFCLIGKGYFCSDDGVFVEHVSNGFLYPMCLNKSV